MITRWVVTNFKQASKQATLESEIYRGWNKRRPVVPGGAAMAPQILADQLINPISYGPETYLAPVTFVKIN